MSLLTERDKRFISQIASDMESGHDLLCKRSHHYYQMRKKLSEAREAKLPDAKQAEILEVFKQCSDYSYYQSLPLNERLV